MELSVRMGNDSRQGISIVYNRLSSYFQTMKHTMKHSCTGETGILLRNLFESEYSRYR